jgi:prenyltransferase beta subunit
MALQALSKYRDRKEVADAVEKGVALLSDRQNESGGYGDGDGENSESVAQVIVALSELGIAVDDSRFVKNGNTLMDGLLQFRQADGGFSHLKDTESDLLATEQAFYAMVAAKRLEEGKTSLYDMSDVG